jgi:hypothetical protein
VIHQIRAYILPALTALVVVFGLASWAWPFAKWIALGSLALLVLGLRDRAQTKHSILRSYPVLGHLRFLLEDFGPELRQYIVEHNIEGRPFDRDTRSLVYQRSKGVQDKKAFGTEKDVYAEGYSWISHSMAPRAPVADASKSMRIEFGGSDCSQPYSSSIFNISAVSLGRCRRTLLRR